MYRYKAILTVIIVIVWLTACSTAYKATPTSFRMPSAYPNETDMAGAEVAARAFNNKDEAKATFGFDIRGANILPVEVVFNNIGPHPLEIVASQTFLEDTKDNMWPILSIKHSNERATKYAVANKMIKEGAYHGFWGAATGAIVGAAIGIVSGENVGSAVGKGAAVGAAAGAVYGGAKANVTDDAEQNIIDDFRDKSLRNREIAPGMISYGFLFFPGEAGDAKQLRLQLKEKDTGKTHVANFKLQDVEKK